MIFSPEIMIIFFVGYKWSECAAEFGKHQQKLSQCTRSLYMHLKKEVRSIYSVAPAGRITGSAMQSCGNVQFVVAMHPRLSNHPFVSKNESAWEYSVAPCEYCGHHLSETKLCIYPEKCILKMKLHRSVEEYKTIPTPEAIKQKRNKRILRDNFPKTKDRTESFHFILQIPKYIQPLRNTHGEVYS